MVEAFPASCDLSDACDGLGIAAVRTGALRQLWPECPSLAGTVRVARLEPAEGADSPLADLLEFLAGAREHVVLIDLGGRIDVQCWGTVLAAAARHFGVLGALVNGAARDIDGLGALGLPCYARGVYPGAMRGRLRLVSVNEPVELDGQAVIPGSFAVVDASGAVFMPEARAAEALALAVERAEREAQQLRSVASGVDPRTVFGIDRQSERP